MFLMTPVDDRLPAKERILGLTINGADEAYPFSRLVSMKQPLGVYLGGQHVTIIFDAHSQAAGAPLAAKHIPGYTGYWFAWAAFHPKTAIWDALGSEIKQPAGANNRGDLQSGVYGFSGTDSSFGENKLRVVGECMGSITSPTRNKWRASIAPATSRASFASRLRPDARS
jgi:hypothetical protein